MAWAARLLGAVGLTDLEARALRVGRTYLRGPRRPGQGQRPARRSRRWRSCWLRAARRASSATRRSGCSRGAPGPTTTWSSTAATIACCWLEVERVPLGAQLRRRCRRRRRAALVRLALGELLARCGHAAARSALRGPPLGHRDLAVCRRRRRARRAAPGRPRAARSQRSRLGIGAAAARSRAASSGESTPVQHRLGDEPLDLVGVDVGLAAAGEPGALRAGVAALPARARARDQPLAAVAADEQAARAGSGARPCSCAAPGRPAARGSAPSPPG